MIHCTSFINESNSFQGISKTLNFPMPFIPTQRDTCKRGHQLDMHDVRPTHRATKTKNDLTLVAPDDTAKPHCTLVRESGSVDIQGDQPNPNLVSANKHHEKVYSQETR